MDMAWELPEKIQECRDFKAELNISKTRPVDFYDLDVVLDTGNYEYLDDLQVSGFDDVSPRVNKDAPYQVVFSFDKDPGRPEPLTAGGGLRFTLRKRCFKSEGLSASANFVNRLHALSEDEESGMLKKRTVSTYVRPLVCKNADLEVTVTPECCRVVPERPMKWNIYVTNRGDAVATDVCLKDILGESLHLQNTASKQGAAPEIKNDTPSPGKTTLLWYLGDIPPSRTRKVSVVALPGENQEGQGMTASQNIIKVTSACGDEVCRYDDVRAPDFSRPDECISGEIFEKTGKIHGFFSLTQMYKSNLYQTDEDTENDWATYITPGVWMAVPASRERLVEVETTNASAGGLAVNPFYPKTDRKYQTYFLYSPQYELYYDNPDENMVSHRVDSYFRYNSRNKLSLQVVDQFKRTHDSISSSARDYTINDKYKSNMFNTVATVDPTEKLRFRFDYSNFWLDYDDSENDRANRTDNAFSLYSFFRLTSKMSLFLQGEYIDIRYDDNDLDSDEYRYFAGVRWEITGKSSGRIKGGFGKKEYDKDNILDDADTFMAEIVLDHELTPKTNIVLNAYRKYDEAVGTKVDADNLSNNMATHIRTNMAGLSLTHDITSKLHFNCDASYFDDDYEQEFLSPGVDEREDEEISISPALKFDFSKRLTFDLAYMYTDRDSNYEPCEYTDHTVFLRASVYH